jgi:hypothetical protein
MRTAIRKQSLQHALRTPRVALRVRVEPFRFGRVRARERPLVVYGAFNSGNCGERQGTTRLQQANDLPPTREHRTAARAV